MGRTFMPYSHFMESERERLKPFRRALSKEDKEAFDRLFDRAKMHTSAGVYMAHPWPMKTILLSICFEHVKMIEGILGKLKEKKSWRLSFSPPRLIRNYFLRAMLFLPRIFPPTWNSSAKNGTFG
jgi:hypothetical protein